MISSRAGLAGEMRAITGTCWPTEAMDCVSSANEVVLSASTLRVLPAQISQRSAGAANGPFLPSSFHFARSRSGGAGADFGRCLGR